MYEIYETESFIIRSYNSRESNKRTLIFSKDFGLIWVDSSGSRKIDSKFKPFLQDFSRVKIFLVRGKNGFRVTGGELIKNIFFDMKDYKKNKILRIKNFYIFLEKILIKNHKEEKIFNLIDNFWKEIENSKFKNLKKVEIVFIIYLLEHFGYFNIDFLKEINVEFSNDFNKIKITDNQSKKIIREINEQIKKIAW